MQVNVVYHEKLREDLGKSIETLNLDESATVSSLLSRLAGNYPNVKLSAVKFSRGGTDLNADAFLSDGETIDITGG